MYMIEMDKIMNRQGNVNYQEVHHSDQVGLMIDEIKQRIIYGSTIPNMCQCQSDSMILIDNKSADIHFNTLEQLNILYDLWIEV